MFDDYTRRPFDSFAAEARGFMQTVEEKSLVSFASVFVQLLVERLRLEIGDNPASSDRYVYNQLLLHLNPQLRRIRNVLCPSHSLVVKEC